jgi:hypothetical protein
VGADELEHLLLDMACDELVCDAEACGAAHCCPAPEAGPPFPISGPGGAPGGDSRAAPLGVRASPVPGVRVSPPAGV